MPLTPIQVAPEEYLATDYGKPDREYVRGEVLERSMPDIHHGAIQMKLGIACAAARGPARLLPVSEVRMRLAPDVIRIPDVAVYRENLPAERFPSEPPLIVVEIVSQDDRYSDLMKKLLEYQEWGVPHIWVVDPGLRSLAAFVSSALMPLSAFALPGYDLSITAVGLFD